MLELPAVYALFGLSGAALWFAADAVIAMSIAVLVAAARRSAR
jgi:hypothetical protein